MKRPAGVRAAIYTRISDDRSGEGAGVQRQQESCEKLAADRSLEVVGLYRDNSQSAMTGVRSEFQRLLNDVRSGEIDCVLVWSVDRLYRRLTDLIDVTNALGSVPVYSVRSGDVDLSTADGRMRANIMGSVAQHESEKKGERVTEAAAARARRGGFQGGRRRFGYRHSYTHPTTGRPTGPLVLVPEEADAIVWAYSHISAGGTLEAVKREWRSRGLHGPNGAAFNGVTVRDVLLRPMNAGLSTYKGETVGSTEGPAIVAETDFLRVRAILSDPRRRTTVGRPPKSLLAGLLKCAVCMADEDQESALVSAKNRFGGRARGNIKTPIYTCREGHVTRTREPLDRHISELVMKTIEMQTAPVERLPDLTPASADLLERERIDNELAAMPLLLANGVVRAVDYGPAMEALRQKRRAVDARIGVASGKPATAHAISSTGSIRTWWYGDADASIHPATTDQRRGVIKEWIERIDMGRGQSGKFTTTGLNVVPRE